MPKEGQPDPEDTPFSIYPLATAPTLKHRWPYNLLLGLCPQSVPGHLSSIWGPTLNSLGLAFQSSSPRCLDAKRLDEPVSHTALAFTASRWQLEERGLRGLVAVASRLGFPDPGIGRL